MIEGILVSESRNYSDNQKELEKSYQLVVGCSWKQFSKDADEWISNSFNMRTQNNPFIASSANHRLHWTKISSNAVTHIEHEWSGNLSITDMMEPNHELNNFYYTYRWNFWFLFSAAFVSFRRLFVAISYASLYCDAVLDKITKRWGHGTKFASFCCKTHSVSKRSLFVVTQNHLLLSFIYTLQQKNASLRRTHKLFKRVNAGLKGEHTIHDQNDEWSALLW